MATVEEWRPVVGYEGLYEVSNLGRVRSLDRLVGGRWEKKPLFRGVQLAPIKRKDGYWRVNLCKDGVRKATLIHRIVAMAFIENPLNLPMINHKDENKTNNCVENLEWCNASYNTNYGTRNEKVSKSKTGKPIKYRPGGKRRMIESRCKKVVGTRCDNNAKIYFQSISSANFFGFNPSCISHCLNKRRESYKGYTWEVV